MTPGSETRRIAAPAEKRRVVTLWQDRVWRAMEGTPDWPAWSVPRRDAQA